jgi:hypothetical protein
MTLIIQKNLIIQVEKQFHYDKKEFYKGNIGIVLAQHRLTSTHSHCIHWQNRKDLNFWSSKKFYCHDNKSEFNLIFGKNYKNCWFIHDNIIQENCIQLNLIY